MLKSSTMPLIILFILIQIHMLTIVEGIDLTKLIDEKINNLAENFSYPQKKIPQNIQFSKIYIEGLMVKSEDKDGHLISEGRAGKDDVRVIRETINAMDGGEILLEGLFKIIAPIDNLKPGIIIKGISGKTIFDCSKIENSVFFVDDDNYSNTTTKIVEDIFAGNDSITLDENLIYKKGEFIKLIDDESIMDFKKGQIFKIEKIDGNRLFLDKKVDDNYKVKDNANIRKLNLLNNITIDQIEFFGPGMDTNLYLFRGYLLKDLRFTNNTVKSFGRAAIELIDSIDCNISNNNFSNIFMPGLGYAISLGNACENLSITNNYFTVKGRHYIAFGGSTGDYNDGGFSRKIKIVNNYFENSTSEAINTHPPFKGPIDIIKNVFVSCDKGISIYNGNSNIYYNRFNNCPIGIQLVGDQERTYKVYDNTFENCNINLTIEIDVGDRINDHIDEGCFFVSKHELHFCNSSSIFQSE